MAVFGLLLLELGVQPSFEASVVDVLDRSLAVAGLDFRVIVAVLLGPAESANLVHFFLGRLNNVLSFFEFFLIPVLGDVEALRVGLELSYLELHSPNLQDVVLPNLVAVWSERSHNQP